MGKVLKAKIQLRRDTSKNWQKYDPVLLNGEAAVSLDLNQIKIGNGISKWSELEYISNGSIMGFDAAEVGAYPVKQSDDTIKWIVPTAVTAEGIQQVLNKQNEDIAVIKAATEKAAAAPKISLHDVLISPQEDGVISIPLATQQTYGIVKSSDEDEKISVLEDGTMVVNSLNVNKLIQSEGEELILNANY